MHVHDHKVLEVVWLGEVGSLTMVRSKWAATSVAQQVVYGERYDVFAGTRHLQLLAHCWK